MNLVEVNSFLDAEQKRRRDKLLRATATRGALQRPLLDFSQSIKKQKKLSFLSSLQPLEFPIHRVVLLKNLLQDFPQITCILSSLLLYQAPAADGKGGNRKRQILFFLSERMIPLFEQRTLVLALKRYFFTADQYAKCGLIFVQPSPKNHRLSAHERSQFSRLLENSAPIYDKNKGEQKFRSQWELDTKYTKNLDINYGG